MMLGDTGCCRTSICSAQHPASCSVAQGCRLSPTRAPCSSRRAGWDWPSAPPRSGRSVSRSEPHTSQGSQWGAGCCRRKHGAISPAWGKPGGCWRGQVASPAASSPGQGVSQVSLGKLGCSSCHLETLLAPSFVSLTHPTIFNTPVGFCPPLPLVPQVLVPFSTQGSYICLAAFAATRPTRCPHCECRGAMAEQHRQP